MYVANSVPIQHLLLWLIRIVGQLVSKFTEWAKRAISDVDPSQKDVELDEAGKVGFEASVDASAENPYLPDSAEHKSWADGFNYGRHLRETAW